MVVLKVKIKMALLTVETKRWRKKLRKAKRFI